MRGDASLHAATPASTEADVDQICLLLPVWGYRFIGRFLEFCLPTLLAPNNIPALARELPCQFILLSSEDDVPLIQSHPTWQRLEQVCAAEIQLIDDLITEANHTATITLAFERSIRQAGDAALHTCFFFLMSDYLLADGSLRTVLAAIQKGASGVLVGNFQVIAEDAALLLRAEGGAAGPEIALAPRPLVQWSLEHLHPATVANIVNAGLTHNAHTNRLFWRVDDNTLIGRFYLMHAIAIHPEVTSFVVGSSWDYSLIPELCPSGNVITLTDSDDYLVIELQSRGYESDNLQSGPITAAELAAGLAEWTTELHRKNVEETLVFHAEEIPAQLPAAIAQSEAFVKEVRDILLSAAPAPHRNHPYWVGSYAVNRLRSNRPLSREDWNYLLSDPGLSSPGAPPLPGLRAKLLGFRPHFTRLHPSYPDYKLAANALEATLSAGGRVLLVAGDPKAFSQWAARVTGEVFTIGFEQLLELSRHAYMPLVDSFDSCLAVVDENQVESMDELLRRALPLMRSNGLIHLLLLPNPRPAATAVEFSRVFAREAARVLQKNVRSVEIYYVPSGRFQWAARNMLNTLLANANMESRRRLLFILAAAPTALAVYFANLRSKALRAPPSGIWSSVFLTLHRAEGTTAPPPRFREDRIRKHGSLLWRWPVSSSGKEADEHRTKPQTQPELARLVTDHPEQIAITLARYRFVGRLLGHRHDAAEFGCVHPSGTRLIRRDLRQFSVYDSRPEVVSNLQWRFSDDASCAVRMHDILAGPLPKPHDSIFSIDFIQYLSREEGNLFVRNLRDSLGRQFDFLIIGSPSLQTASEGVARNRMGVDVPADIGDSGGPRIYRRTALELLALMRHYFHNAFVFSMLGDQFQPGIVPEAEFSFALGCGNR